MIPLRNIWMEVIHLVSSLRPVSTQENKHRIGSDRTGLSSSCILHTAGRKKLKILQNYYTTEQKFWI